MLTSKLCSQPKKFIIGLQTHSVIACIVIIDELCDLGLSLLVLLLRLFISVDFTPRAFDASWKIDEGSAQISGLHRG